ncbi:MAG TPA: trehalase family glycosidase, partial [Candidatus Acidoferrum sp.]|nr:trehalase family glycosidase [Candidatus Acidoferrum sp.]
LIRRFGYIPNGNRTYYLGRSQPPMFALAVKLLEGQQGKLVLVKYLPYLLPEYRFWMKDYKQLHPLAPSYKRVVLMPDGSYLNRYYDNKRTPRPEGYKEDLDVAHQAFGRVPSDVYLNCRAACESGWDFSSRWLKDGKTLSTIRTVEILPVDLNCLLVILEQTIADAYKQLHQRGAAATYTKRAEKRAAAIRTYCWSKKNGFFADYDFVAGKRTPHLSLAGVFPLYAGVATKEQAAAVAKMLEQKFLKPGGLLTTLHETGQQWDAPNGWAALQWVAIQGLRRYGYAALADEIKHRWLNVVTTVFKREGKIVEKYNVKAIGKPAGGGEYVLQDGFGMTNGVVMALLKEDEISVESK